MRVKKPFKNCRVEILQNDHIVKTIKMRKAIPAEMIQIEVKREDLISLDNLKVVVKND
nr:hypothetical protein [Clostridium sp.]